MKIQLKHAIPALAAVALMASSCDENSWNDKLDGFEEPGVYTKTETIEYKLTAADYSAIASNSANQALAAGDEAEAAALKAIGTAGCFADAAQARKYLPAYLESTSFPYFALNDGSSVKVTYAVAENQPAEVLAINKGVVEVKLNEEDYQEAWGSDDNFINAFAPMLPPAKNIPNVLMAAGNTGAEGDYLLVNYNYSATNPIFGQVGGGTATDEPANGIYLSADFHDGDCGFTAENTVMPEGLTYIWNVQADKGWAKASAYANGTNYDAEAWFVSPAFKLGAQTNAVLTFQHATNFFASAEILPEQAVVAVREPGGAWQKLTPDYPSSMSWTFIPSGSLDLSAWNGKTIQVGFCYKSTAAKAGTWEIEDVKVLTGAAAAKAGVRRHAPVGEVAYAAESMLLYNNGSTLVAPADTYLLQPADYTSMGQTYGNLSNNQPDLFLPVFLKSKFPYAADGDSKIVVYKYYAASVTSVVARQYVYTGGEWSYNLGLTTEQFTRADGKWAYNPSVVLTLPYARNTDPSYSTYMACLDWVFANVTKKLYPDAKAADGKQPGPPFIDYRGNAEFYSGTSAYYGNVDIRAVTAINNAPDGYTAYDGLTNEQITELIKRRFCTETMPGALAILYPDAAPVEGMDITYTINFTAYDGAAKEETIVFAVTGPAKFTYRSCTWYANGEDAGF